MILQRFWRYITIIFLLGVSAVFSILLHPPKDYPVNTIFTIESGKGISILAKELKDVKMIRSTFLFKTFSVLSGGPRGLKSGDYNLVTPQSVFTLAHRFSVGDYDLQAVSVTFPEGLNVFEMAKIIHEEIPNISEEEFIQVAVSNEGYLFPDTYLFFPNVSAENVVVEMKRNFDLKISTLDIENMSKKMELSDVIKLASIIELEGRTSQSRQMIAGILLNRLDQGMPLQVDVSFKYINGKNTFNLTLADLKIDSPYNSYMYRGLPPTPIANPGLDSISAVLNSTPTRNLYFLTGLDGEMYYAETYDKHLQNRRLYLE
jgi:UPF0755 protein